MLCLSALCALFLLFSACAMLVQSNGNLQTYIVHVNRPNEGAPAETDDLESFHRSFLPKEIQSSDEALDRLLYSYRHVMSGFSARLTSEEVSAMHDREGFVSARLESVLQLQTTHSANFLGLPQNPASVKGSHLGKGVIIGVLDGGVLPTHPSFNGVGMPPPPGKWKGRCDFKPGQCNNKLIGARTFDLSSKARAKTSLLPDDEDGHGTHTASTAAGAFVHGAQVLGNVKGTAVGMAPDAHLAIYKVCFDDCLEADILAALDAAVDDGVDVLSLSIGDVSKPFFNNTIAIGSFAAIQKGIFVSCAAGNLGPVEGSLSNEAPWILTVGASTIDRNVVSTTKLGNGLEFDGETVFQPYFPSKLIPLIYAEANGKPNASLCAWGSLNPADVKGKVVLCERGVVGRITKGLVVKDAGGAAMILMNDEASGFSTIADAHVLPASHVSHSAGLQIKAYINSTKAPTATLLFKGTVLGNPNTPAVASFSSRGPNLASPGILKPDIIGPGVSILAAWPFPLNNDTKSKLTFNVETGTSMSCPHLSGIAALLKSAHPNWSPAAIKSAIMTTAEQQNQKGSPIVDERQQPADVFAIGAGHVNPTKANDPGLIYDISPIDYIPYLCGLGYTDQQVGIVAGRLIRCSKWPSIPEGELNYPSFAVTLGPSTTFTRTVTNVGEANSRYTVTVIPPPGVNVVVKPPSLYFRELNQKASYSVTFTRAGSALKPDEHVQGYLRWVSGQYTVRSPISVQFKKPKLL